MRWILIAGVLIAIHAFAADGVSTDNKTAAQIQAEFERERATPKAPPHAAPVSAPQSVAAKTDAMPASAPESAGIGAGFVLFLLAVYFLPAIIAGGRHHHNSTAIFVLNMLLGWTLLGWVIALVWACTAVRPPTAAT